MVIKVDEGTYINPAWVWRIIRTVDGQSVVKLGIGEWVEEITVNKPIDELAKLLNEDIS